MQFLLIDQKESVVEAWERFCGDIEGVSVKQGSILQQKCDAIVSPANSFGFMDGGLDLQISLFFGWKVQDRLQELIRTKHHGELLVGAAEIVETDDQKIPYVISAPTMRVPMILKDTVNVYLATRAVILLVKYGVLSDGRQINEAVNRVALPGMGTGVGRVPHEICAKQMSAAFHEFLLEEHEFPEDWSEAQLHHQMLYSNQVRDLQF